MKTKSVVVVDPEIMSGTPWFAGTRVPARTLIDHLEAGDSLEVFLKDFPTVTREQAIASLEEGNTANELNTQSSQRHHLLGLSPAIAA